MLFNEKSRNLIFGNMFVFPVLLAQYFHTVGRIQIFKPYPHISLAEAQSGAVASKNLWGQSCEGKWMQQKSENEEN